MENTFLVTGALGCIGAWTVYHLVQQGKRVVSFDIDQRGHRLNLLMTPDEQKQITFVTGDLSDSEHVFQTFEKHQITHVIHLAAMQVPLCKENPVRGAQVNVVGTVNIFEAARRVGVSHVTYASSIAVFGSSEEYPSEIPVSSDAAPHPHTLYGVYKQANEGTARVYWQDHQVSSIALRPYIVYGVGRDQGMTSDPTKAMLAAAAGKPFHINFGGQAQFQFASDVAMQFIEAASQPLAGSLVLNMGSSAATIERLIALIKAAKPDSQITMTDKALPFPKTFDDTQLRQYFPQVYDTPLEVGIPQTIAHFERCLADGRLQY
jgi:nucleoside-diphosphate-sugar epimerase